MEITGGCLCRAVRYSISAEPVVTRVCWCRGMAPLPRQKRLDQSPARIFLRIRWPGVRFAENPSSPCLGSSCQTKLSAAPRVASECRSD